jgi:hypothetical protein
MKILNVDEKVAIVKVTNSEDMIVRKNNATVVGNVDILHIFNDHIEMIIDTDYGKIKRNFHYHYLLIINDAIFDITHPSKSSKENPFRGKLLKRR